MRRFDEHDLVAALAHAAEGGQALYLYRPPLETGLRSLAHQLAAGDAMARRAVRRGEHLGRLYDQDAARLRQTLRGLEYYRWHPRALGTAEQHHALMGVVLGRALALCVETANA